MIFFLLDLPRKNFLNDGFPSAAKQTSFCRRPDRRRSLLLARVTSADLCARSFSFLLTILSFAAPNLLRRLGKNFPCREFYQEIHFTSTIIKPAQ
jgi:hypothetical protein